MIDTLTEDRTIPIIVQSFLDKWGVVSRKEYRKTRGHMQNFEKETFFTKMMFCVNNNILTVAGVAKLLGSTDMFVKGRARGDHKQAEQDQGLVKKSGEFEESELLHKDWLDLKPVAVDQRRYSSGQDEVKMRNMGHCEGADVHQPSHTLHERCQDFDEVQETITKFSSLVAKS